MNGEAPVLPKNAIGTLEYTPEFKQNRRIRCINCLLIAAAVILYAGIVNLRMPQLLDPVSACQIILVVGLFAALWLYRLFDLYARKILVSDRGLVFQRPFHTPRLLSWGQVGLVTGDRLAGTVAIHLRDGSVWPLPSPLAGLGQLWLALESRIADVVDKGAWEALLRMEKGAQARPPLALEPLPDPATLAPPAPRRVAFTGSVWFGRCLLAGFFGMCLSMVQSLNAGQEIFAALASSGEHVAGTVTDWKSGMLNGMTTYEMDYTFRVGEVVYHGTSYVPGRMFRAVPPGGPCLITYLPDNPQVSCQGDARERHLEQLAGNCLAYGLLLPVLAFAFLRLEWDARRQARLLREGNVAAGQVIDCARPRWPLGGKRRVRYRFETADGALLISEARLPGAGIVFPGDVLPVVYDPAAPRGNLLLAACGLARLVDAAPAPRRAPEAAIVGA